MISKQKKKKEINTMKGKETDFNLTWVELIFSERESSLHPLVLELDAGKSNTENQKSHGYQKCNTSN